jgi:hypothetical protein
VKKSKIGTKAELQIWRAVKGGWHFPRQGGWHLFVVSLASATADLAGSERFS